MTGVYFSRTRLEYNAISDAGRDKKAHLMTLPNDGGFYNHNLYFIEMSLKGGGEPDGERAKAISQLFGQFSGFKEKISATATGQFGSGWGWLSSDSSGKLSISASPNQNKPIRAIEGKLIPILDIDVWGHAYYLNYHNLRADYIQALFSAIG